MVSWIGLTSQTSRVSLSEVTPSQRKELLGAVGEGIVRRFFQSNGLSVQMSEDKFDAEKDMIVEGQTVEVKTLLPIYKYNAFCLPVQQSKKCEEVDRLIFIEVPNLPEEYVTIYESFRDKETGHRYDFREFFNKQQCQFYRLTNLVKIGRIQDKTASQAIWNLSPSNFKGFKDVFTKA
jgi:hypothetical protein